MNSYITIFIVIANIIGVLLLYYSFGKNIDKQKRLFYTMLYIGVIYILTLISYTLSSIGIEKITSASSVKNTIIMSFVPVNTIVFIPFLIHSYMKAKNKEITVSQLSTRATIIIIIAIIALVCEFFYFRNLQKNIINLQNQVKDNTNIVADDENSNLETKNKINEVINNEINVVNNITDSNVVERNVSVNSVSKKY